jgi:hypothetical protein
MVAKYLLGYVESPKNRIQLDDMYGEYCDYINANARDYRQTLTEFRKSVTDKFPDSVVKDGAVTGISKRVKAAPVEVVRDPFDILMGNCYSDMVHEYPKRTFTATELAYFSKQKVEDVEKWLQNHPFMYWNRNKNKYTFINGD